MALPNNRVIALKVGNPEQIIQQYLAGYYPYNHPLEEYILWDRAAVRPVIELGPRTAGRAERMARRINPEFEIAEDRDFDGVLRELSRRELRRDTWVRGGVLTMYRRLHAAGYTRTFECYLDGVLAGSLLGIELPGAFLAETMFHLRPDASKACLCRAVIKYYRLGFRIIDTQMPHPRDHPAGRIGETILGIDRFVELLNRTIREFSAHRELFSGRDV
jgi:leucyl/phenylalanyl-tRNA---protein transferase